jgi:hypothetical protein
LIQVNGGMPNESTKGKHNFHGIAHHWRAPKPLGRLKMNLSMETIERLGAWGMLLNS